MIYPKTEITKETVIVSAIAGIFLIVYGIYVLYKRHKSPKKNDTKYDEENVTK